VEIQQTKAYSIPFINIDQNSTIMFKDAATRDSYFNATGTTLVNSVVKDVWRLYVDYLMVEGTPYPKAGVYNYFRFKLKRGGYLFFYVYDYEIKGAGQILYKLKLDTLQTYYLHSNDFQPIGEQLVYREHKDRFNIFKQPIIDQTLESLDIKPRIVEHVKTYPQNECKLALVKIGGGVKDGNVLSKAAYFWKVYSPFPLVNKLQVNNQDFELLLGWGVRTDVNAVNDKIDLLFIAESGATATVEIDADSYINFRFGISSEGYQTLFLISGDDWEGLYTKKSGDVIVGRYLNDPTQLRFHSNGRLYINLTQSTSTFMIRYDAGIYETAPSSEGYGRTLFLKFIPSGGDAEPFSESALNPQAAETQQIISIPDIQMLNLKGFGSNGGKGVYVPLNKEINELTYDAETEITNLTPNFTTTFSNAMTRIKYNDPKLLHSQFNTLFFTLQNEQIPLKLENTRNNKQIKLKLNLNVSNYSKALLRLQNGGNNMIYNELYELEKVINMNNEYATIKSEINDYIDLHSRNDQRLNELQTSKAERDLVYKGVGQVVSIGGGIAAGAISGSIVPGIGTVAGAVAGAATGIIKGALNIAQGIQNLNQFKEEIKLQYDSKIKGLAYSLINITGVTPDLAQKQNTNKLKLFQFKLLDYEKDYLDLYFHNFGYQTLEYKIPNLRSRKYFNFIQMELVNYHINNRLITAEVIEDIRLRFRTGVTLFHYNEENMIKIDTQKQYENYERIFEAFENEYYNYAQTYYTATNNSALFENAWNHSLIVDPLEIIAISGASDPRGTAQYPNGETYGVIIPQSVTSIGDYAFFDWNSNNQPLVIPASVTSIGYAAFRNWLSNNHPLVIPESVTSIGSFAFAYWEANNQPLVIPSSVTGIGQYSFYNWKLVPYIVILATTPPTLLTSYAFAGQNNAPIYVPDESVDAYKTATNWVDLADRIFPISDK